MRDWQEKMALFWGQYPWIFHILRTSVLWFCLAVLTAYFDQTREYTSLFVLLAIIVAVSREYIPLAPTPFNVYNTVTSREDAYTTAAQMMAVTLMSLAFVGVFVVMAEQAGNVAYHTRTNFKSSAPSYWGIEPLPWLTVIIIAVPLLFFMSLIVSTRFVSPYLLK
jgi:hypothetical protein